MSFCRTSALLLPAMVIHLRRNTARRARVEALLAQLGPGADVMPAIDGATMSQAQLAAAQGPCAVTPYPFRLRPAEVATFLSHRACWQRILDEGHPAALVLEDDVDLGPRFPAALELAVTHLPETALVRFPVKPSERGPLVAGHRPDIRLLRPETVGLGMRAQVVTRAAAARLLAATSRIDRPVDTFLQLRWLHGVEVLSVWPSGVREVSASLGGSSIHGCLTARQRLRREVLRPIYRLQIALQSRWYRS
ncbi:glycosyltransferase family 25 protein [Oceanicola sp. S124]|uniref:glycosyltransferase family 25 protein n=1 Tax=Oceanicola sp. S124 TaxID=1042378 RepID=UPI0002557E49|nr:glycosyltransferase family 25 protein [Oceanicola sp. S124]